MISREREREAVRGEKRERQNQRKERNMICREREAQ